MDSKSEKKKFWAVYDYGAGGVWFNIYARSREEINRAHPALRVYESLPFPDRFSPEVIRAIEEKLTFDIDERPSGLVEEVLNTISRGK